MADMKRSKKIIKRTNQATDEPPMPNNLPPTDYIDHTTEESNTSGSESEEDSLTRFCVDCEKDFQEDPTNAENGWVSTKCVPCSGSGEVPESPVWSESEEELPPLQNPPPAGDSDEEEDSEEEYEFNEFCEKCGDKMSEHPLSEEAYDEHPDREAGYNAEGDWKCKTCRDEDSEVEEVLEAEDQETPWVREVPDEEISDKYDRSTNPNLWVIGATTTEVKDVVFKRDYFYENQTDYWRGDIHQGRSLLNPREMLVYTNYLKDSKIKRDRQSFRLELNMTKDMFEQFKQHTHNPHVDAVKMTIKDYFNEQWTKWEALAMCGRDIENHDGEFMSEFLGGIFKQPDSKWRQRLEHYKVEFRDNKNYKGHV